MAMTSIGHTQATVGWSCSAVSDAAPSWSPALNFVLRAAERARELWDLGATEQHQDYAQNDQQLHWPDGLHELRIRPVGLDRRARATVSGSNVVTDQDVDSMNCVARVPSEIPLELDRLSVARAVGRATAELVLAGLRVPFVPPALPDPLTQVWWLE
jgi:hypothetical protein